MIRALLPVLALAAVAAGCASTPDTPEGAYLSGLRSIGVDVADDAVAVRAGRAGCEQLDAGISPAAAGEAVGTVLRTGEGVGALRLAAATYCPRHLAAVRAAAQS